jgi:hypothetical protein
MSDTGAPWNLPYPLPTDLVRDGADAIKDLAEATADGLDAAGPPGIGSNVVSVTTSTTSSTSSLSFVAASDLDVTITPTSATSKILVICTVIHHQTLGSFNVQQTQVALYRGATELDTFHTGSARFYTTSPDVGTIVYLDSPTTTSAVTYAIYHRALNSGASVINRSNDEILSPFSSSITAIEVAP